MKSRSSFLHNLQFDSIESSSISTGIPKSIGTSIDFSFENNFTTLFMKEFPMGKKSNNRGKNHAFR